MFYQKHKSLIVILSVVALVVFNLIPLSTAIIEWPAGITIWFPYFYQAEGIFLAVFGLAMFAKRFTVFFFMLGLTGTFVHLLTPVYLGDPKMLLIFWGLYSLCWIAYLDLRQRHMGLIMDRRPPVRQMLIYFGFMVGAISICFLMTVIINDAWGDVVNVPNQVYGILIAMAVIVPTLSISVLKIIDMIGAQHFLALLIGAYYRPVEREKIVLFIDLAGSTAMAERLGPLHSTNLIARFIFDASGIFRIYGGDVINYTGDGLVATWPKRQGDRPLLAILALRDRVRGSISFYLREFGLVPEFRVGIHSGKVIMSQVGEEKQFLALYGDTVNTAGRLEQMNKEMNTRVLISGEVVSSMSKSCKEMLVSKGLTNLKGKGDSIEIYTLKKERGEED
ncbi:MAG TPA: adenylate/guanylate cyclase domain-containing protein [Patescibacteria group bacterium]|nr:adenylate/guanylate cyclase domain-containing protein [Patescibacteria group bacterium]